MPPFDREGALKSAEKALRQGRIDAAISEYVRIVEAQPRDWNSANALGDLYVRAGQAEKGVGQYTRIADHLAEEGFYPKAAALYKKILKVKPDDEHSLLQSAELAAKQGTLADAKKFYQQVVDRRRAKGDGKGAAEISIKLGMLDPDDLEARLKAAKAAVEMGDVLTALGEFRDVAGRLDKMDRGADALMVWRAAYDLDPGDETVRRRLLDAYIAANNLEQARGLAQGADELKQLAGKLEAAGRIDEMLAVLADVAAADPADLEVRSRLAMAYVAKGDVERARAFLSPETAGENPALWLMLAEVEMRSGRLAEGKAAVERAMALDPAQAQAAVVLGCSLAEALPDAGFACVETVSDAAINDRDYAAAAVALREFTIRAPQHLVGLMRLVEVCVDGGLEAAMYEAQAQLADAYLQAGRALEARIISEDLVAREPWNKGNLERFRRALEMLGETDPDAIIADRLSGESPFMATDKMDLNEGQTFEAPAPPEPPPKPAPAPAPPKATAPPVPQETEIDLSEALEAESPGPDKSLPLVPPPPRSLDQVFRGMRDEVGRQPSEENAAEQYRLAITYHDMGMVEDAVAALEVAVRSPRQRFDAASMLGRLCLERKDMNHAIEWLERAAEAPAPTPDAGRALLYDLAQALEEVGESARALAVYVELESESGGYRDVAGHIDRLSKVQARG